VYLFLIDYSFMSSEHLQKIIGQVLPEEDVLNCFSPATMLKVSEKLKPRLVIIDFSLVEDDKVALVETLREKCPDTYILAVIDADYYDQLYQAIEKSLVDDYIVKPISEEEFAARILITVSRKRLSKPDFTISLPDQLVSSEKFETVEDYESEEPDYKETMQTDSLLDEPIEKESTKIDYFAPRFEEGYYSKKEEEELLDSGYDQSNRQLNDLASDGLHAPEQLDNNDKIDDLFDDKLVLQDAEETSRSFLQGDPLETPPGETGLGEDYFNDLFVEHYDAEETAVKPEEPDIQPPASSFSSEFDNPPDKDIAISINDFMPGESADQYLKEKEDEVAFNFDEDLLDRFLSDEDDKNEVVEEDDDEENEPSGPVSFLSVLMNVILALLLLMMASLSFFLIHNRVAEGPPSLAGFTFLVMQDEGVNADANPGSLAVVRTTDVTSISLGDIINYKTPASLNATATKRVVEINREEGLKFVTSGDGAGAVQTNTVPAEDVLGKVLVSIPFYGKMVDYVQTIQGLILLIFVPGLIIIVFQLAKIVLHLSGNRKSGRRGRYREVVEEAYYN
jgi:signal peptidase I